MSENTRTYDEIYVEVLRREREHLLSLHDPYQEGTGHYNTAAAVLLDRINQLEKPEYIKIES